MKLFVHRCARRRGLAKSPMVELEDTARRLGRTLLLMDARKGGEAEKLCESLGYVRYGDPTWTPLIVTPGFPEYPSGHSCVSGAAGRILTHYFGDQTPVVVGSNTLPGVTRQFPNRTAALEEVKSARVFAGIHFRTACDDGQALGIAVADYINWPFPIARRPGPGG